MRARIGKVAIRHIAAAVPVNAVLNQSLNFDDRVKRNIIKMTGVEERRVLPPGMTLKDLYLPAARNAMESLGWTPDTIDGIIVVSQTHEYKSPATACHLHGELSVSREAFAFDIGMGCSGYVTGLYSATSAINASAGAAKRVLLFVGDAISTYCHPRNKASAFLFGDAASCTAIEYSADASPMGFVLRTDGSGWNNIIVEHGGLKHPIEPASWDEYVTEDGNFNTRASVNLNGTEVFDFTLREVPALIEDVAAASSLALADVDAFLMHQANTFILKHLAEKVGVKERTPVNMAKYGNTSCASIPLLIADRPEECLKHNAMLLGFGVGWSMAGCMADLAGVSSALMEIR